jgi:hypothetical protein
VNLTLRPTAKVLRRRLADVPRARDAPPTVSLVQFSAVWNGFEQLGPV